MDIELHETDYDTDIYTDETFSYEIKVENRTPLPSRPILENIDADWFEQEYGDFYEDIDFSHDDIFRDAYATQAAQIMVVPRELEDEMLLPDVLRDHLKYLLMTGMYREHKRLKPRRGYATPDLPDMIGG